MQRFLPCLATGMLALAFFSSNAAPLHAQQHDSSEMRTLPQAELDVVKVLLAQEKAWNKGDIEAFAASYKNSPDTVFLGSELYRGYDAMLGRYKRNYPDKATMGTLTFSALQPRTLDEHFAILTGEFSLERDKKHGGAAHGLFSLVLEKTDAGWKIVLDHAN